MVVELAPGTPTAQAAAEHLAKISSEPTASQPTAMAEPEAKSVEELEAEIEAQPDNAELLVQLGTRYLDAGKHAEAEEMLRKAIALDESNAMAHKWLGIALTMTMSGETYDERIHEDTNWAANLAFEVLEHLDKAVHLAPDDIEARFFRGMMGVNMPFFTGKLDTGLEDLKMVIESEAPDSLKTQAMYWLGFGYQKKGMSYWTELVGEYDDAEVFRMVFAGMRPQIKRFDRSQYQGSVVVVDFILGFRDELHPQTAVWIESEEGEFIRTLYVSGFSGYAREVQIVLPVWAATSEFADADAVTGASIDVGHHIYVWDLKDASGKEVKQGKYVVKVEAHYWPSMKYQLASGVIEVGEAEDRIVIEEGDFIPYLEVSYLP
jgi:hypothetical protein